MTYITPEQAVSEPVLRMYGARRLPADNNGEFAHIQFESAHAATAWASSADLEGRSRFRDASLSLNQPTVLIVNLRPAIVLNTSEEAPK